MKSLGSRGGFLCAALLLAVALRSPGQSSREQTQTRPSISQNNRAEHGREFLGLGPPPDLAAAARGQNLFVQSCGFCHGNNATGAEGPDLLRSTLVLHDDKGEVLGPFLHNGRPEKGMPGFAALTEAQSYDIAEFLHARVEEAANRFGYKMQNVVTGNAKAGEEYFNGKGRCKTCHSLNGDLAHIATKFEPADLQAEFLYPSKSPPVTVTVTLPSGESVSGTLKRIDDFIVSLYDSSGVFHSWSRNLVKTEIHDPLLAHRELLDHYSDTDMHNLLAYLVTLK